MYRHHNIVKGLKPKKRIFFPPLQWAVWTHKTDIFIWILYKSGAVLTIERLLFIIIIIFIINLFAVGKYIKVATS